TMTVWKPSVNRFRVSRHQWGMSEITRTYISKKKRSIDMDRVSIVQLDSGRVRFKVRIRKIHRSRKRDQMVFLNSAVRGGDPAEYTSLGFRTRNSAGAYAHNSRTGETCSLRVERKRRTTWVDVPRRCAPWNGDTVDVSTVTGHFQPDATPYSMDRLRLGVF